MLKSSCSVSLALAATCLLWAHGASAQADPATVRMLFDEGRKLAAERDFRAACPKFEESYRLDPGIGTLFNLADCWEHIGRTASAWARYLDVADSARRAGQRDREQIARARAAAIQPKLSRLLVKVESKDTGLEVAKDGAPFGVAQWGTALAVDPGIHTIEAKAPGREPWRTSVSVPGDGQTVTVVVPPLVGSAPANLPSPAPPLAPPSVHPTSDASTTAPASGSGTRTAGWILGGVGLVGLGVGAAAGVVVWNKNQQADAICPTSRNCSRELDEPRYEAAIEAAKTARAVAITGFAVGGAALGTGLVLLLSAPRASGGGLRVTPSLAAGRLGATLEGGF